MKTIRWINHAVLLIYLLFWVDQAVGFFEAYDSIVVEHMEAYGENFIYVTFFALILILFYRIFSKNKNRAYNSTIMCMSVMSALTFYMLGDSVYVYLPWNHNERFVISEYILIYLSAFTVLWLMVNVLCQLIIKHKHRLTIKIQDKKEKML